jgi:hypothetical protein
MKRDALSSDGQGEGPSAAETAATRRSNRNKSKVENKPLQALLLLKEKCFPLFCVLFIHLRLVVFYLDRSRPAHSKEGK